MVPVTADIEEENETVLYDYALRENTIKGFTDGKEAVVQSIYKRLMTERYIHEIYSSDYGIQTEDMFENGADYAASVLEERIREALNNDERIESVRNFVISQYNESLCAEFEVSTVFGSCEIKLPDFMPAGRI